MRVTGTAPFKILIGKPPTSPLLSPATIFTHLLVRD
jgi:hypothetical protein